MSETPHPQQTEITEAEFVAIYGEYPVTNVRLSKPMTINKALKREALLCPVNPEDRVDTKARLQQLAQFVGQEALAPEHLALLTIAEPAE